MARLVVVSFLGAALEAAFLVLVTGLAVALAAGTEVIGPYFGQTLSVSKALALGGGVLLARVAFGFSSVLVSSKLAADVTMEQRARLAHAYLGASWSVQSAEPPGRLQELLTSFVGKATLVVQAFTSGLIALLSLSAFLSISLVMDAVTTGAAALVLVVVGALLVPLRRLVRKLSAKWTKADVAFAGSVAELGALGREMQVFGVRDEFVRQIDALSGEATSSQRRAQVVNQFQGQLYMALAYAALLVGVGLTMSVGVQDLTAMGAVLLLMLRSLSYGQTLASASASVAAYSPFLEQVRDLIDDYQGSPAASGAARPDSPVPLEVCHLGFNYSDEEGSVALDDVSFRIEPGEIVGVIGPSGSGKSTLAQIVLGLRAPSRGAVLAGETDLTSVDREWWATHVSSVPQEALLISGTVAENIAFFRSGVPHDEFRRVADIANILSEIEALSDGFETHLGPRGSRLSGGQRQRLSIARALVGRPRLVVMDEPTSALDTESETLIRDAVSKLRGETSVLLIAHRLSTLTICDKLVVVEGGKISGVGTAVELLETNAFYQSAVRSSALGEGDPK